MASFGLLAQIGDEKSRPTTENSDSSNVVVGSKFGKTNAEVASEKLANQNPTYADPVAKYPVAKNPVAKNPVAKNPVARNPVARKFGAVANKDVKTNEQKVLWGTAVEGVRLGIRPAALAKSHKSLRHGDWLRYEVFIQNETEQAIHIPYLKGNLIYPKQTQFGSINVVGGLEDRIAAAGPASLLRLAPGEAKLLPVPQPSPSPIAPLGTKTDLYGPQTLFRVSVGNYKLFAETTVHFFSAEAKTLKQRGEQAKSVQLRSAVKEIQILPAAKLQIRVAHEVGVAFEHRKLTFDNPNEIVEGRGFTNEVGSLLLDHRDSEVLLDEFDVEYAIAQPDDNDASKYSILLGCSAESAKRLGRETKLESAQPAGKRLVVVLAGKVLSATKLTNEFIGDKFRIRGDFTKAEAVDLIHALLANQNIRYTIVASPKPKKQNTFFNHLAAPFTETKDNPVSWGKPVKGLRLGIRSASFAKNATRFRHGDWLRYEVFARNESDEHIHIPTDPAAMYTPSLNGDVVNLIGLSSSDSFDIPEAVYDQSVVSLAPGQTQVIFAAPQCPIAALGAKPGRYGPTPLFLAPGKYPVFAEESLHVLVGGRADRKRRDGINVTLRSGEAQIQILPAAQLQVRRVNRFTERTNRLVVAKDASLEIVRWVTRDRQIREAVLNRDTEVLFDQDDILAEVAQPQFGDPNNGDPNNGDPNNGDPNNGGRAKVILKPKAAKRLADEIKRFEKQPDALLAIFLGGKVLGATSLSDLKWLVVDKDNPNAPAEEIPVDFLKNLRQAVSQTVGQEGPVKNGDLAPGGDDGGGGEPGAANPTAPYKGLKFLKPYPKLHGLSFEMTRDQFLRMAKQKKIDLWVTPGEDDYWIPTGDDHTVIVMFGNNGDKCSGIQRLRGKFEPQIRKQLDLDSIKIDDAPEEHGDDSPGGTDPGPSLPDLRLEGDEITVEALEQLADREWGTVTLAQAKFTAAIIAQLKYAKSIRSVRLFGENTPGISRLDKVKGMVSLEIGAPLTISSLESLSDLVRLEHLTLPQKLGLTVTGAQQIARLTNLKSLRLYHVDVDDASVKELAPLVNLEMLDLSHTRVTDKGLKVIEKMPKLRHLLLTRYSVTQQLTDGCISSILRLPNLEVLGISGRITNEGMVEIAKATKLRTLSIWNTEVTGDGLAALKDSKVERLMISNYQLGQPSSIPNLKKCRSLKSISVNGEPTGEEDKWQRLLPNLEWIFHS